MADLHHGEFSLIHGRASGYRCSGPILYEARGEVYKRDCGKCDRCFAAKKRDLVARAAAEASTSAEAVFITLTYRDKADAYGEVSPGRFEWLTSDRQKFLRAVRGQMREAARRAVGAPVRWSRKRDESGVLWRDRIESARRRVRYFGAGEVGTKGTKRNHWHIVLFIGEGQGDTGFRSTPRLPSGKPGREWVTTWPHGHVNVDVLPRDVASRVRAIRYCATYLQKAREERTTGPRSRAAAVMFRSLKPCLGAEFLRKQAAMYVEQGLPLASSFVVPGVAYSRGVRAGQLTKNYLAGVARDVWVKAYREAYITRHGDDASMPDSPFRQRFDHDYVAVPVPRARRNPLRVRAKREVWPVLEKPDGLSGILMVAEGAAVLGIVQMVKDGRCLWRPVDGQAVHVPDAGFAGLVGNVEAVGKVDQWIAARRRAWGEWTSPRARFDLYQARAEARREALVRVFCSRNNPVHGVDSMQPLGRVRRLLESGGGYRPQVYRETSVDKLIEREEWRRPAVTRAEVDLRDRLKRVPL